MYKVMRISGIRHIYMFFVLLLCGMQMSCSEAYEALPETDADLAQPGETVRMGFRIALGTGLRTRALPGEAGTQAGTGYENYIGIEDTDYRILFFALDNTLLGAFEPETFVPVDNSAYPQEYEVKGTIPAPPSSDFKVVILANWGAYPSLTEGVTTIDDVCRAGTYAYAAGFVPSADARIPMYGVKQCKGLTFHRNLLTELGTISLLRAMAKVEVVCEGDDVTLTAVSLANYRDGGMCAPLDMTDETDYTETLHLGGTVRTTGSLAFTPDAARKSWLLYVPEYNNLSDMWWTEPSSVITVVRSTGETDKIEFKDYSSANGGAFNIFRNYHYRFNVSFKTNLTVNYTVCPWETASPVNIPFN